MRSLFVLCASLCCFSSSAFAQDAVSDTAALQAAPFKVQHQQYNSLPVIVTKNFRLSSKLSTEQQFQVDTGRFQDQNLLTFQALMPPRNSSRFQYGLKLIVPIMKPELGAPPPFTERPSTNPFAGQYKKNKNIYSFSTTINF